MTNVVPLPDYTNTRKSALNTVIDFTVGPYYQITLDRPLKAGFDYLAGNPNASGSRFIYRNNTIHNNRECGIGIAANNGDVAGDSLIDLALRKDAAVNLPRMFVSLRGLVALFRGNLRRLLAPALIDGFQTPLGAAPRGADWLIADDDEDRIGM